MDSVKLKAIVISSVDYKEKDKLVTLFTLENGLMSATLKSVKKENAKLKFAKEPFCFGDFYIAAKTITNVDVEDSFYDLTKNIDKFYLACAILEAIKTTSTSGESDPELFVETLKAVGTINYSNVNDKYVLVKFLLFIFNRMGYRLSLDKCSICGEDFINKRYLNLDYGEVVCIGCKTSNCIELSPRCHKTFKILAQTGYDDLKTVKLSKNSEDEALNILNINFERRFGKKLNLL